MTRCVISVRPRAVSYLSQSYHQERTPPHLHPRGIRSRLQSIDSDSGSSGDELDDAVQFQVDNNVDDKASH